MKPPVDAPTSRQTRPRVDLERIEGGGKLVAAARDVWVADEVHRRPWIDEIAGLPVPSRCVPLADAHLAGQHERLRTSARLDQAALDEELVELDAGPLRRRRAHPAIVAQRPSPRLDSATAGAARGRTHVPAALRPGAEGQSGRNGRH